MMQRLRRVDASLGSILDEGARTMFFIFSGVALIVCLAYQLISIPYRYSLDYGEAPLVDQAMRLASGQNIYRTDLAAPPYTISNYPPLYVAVVSVGVKLFGPAGAFTAGRIISALCAWGAGIFLLLIVYAATHDRLAALVAGLTLLAFPFVVYWSPFLRIDMLALALSLAGLALLVWKPVSPRRLIGVALLLVAAIYTRQSYGLAAPFAAFVWLLARDWRQALRLALLVGGTGLILFLILNSLTDGGFFFNIVTANVNEFRMDLLRYNWDRLRESALIVLVVGGVSLFLLPRWNPLWTLAAPYLVGAALSAVTIGKIGSNVNYLLELCAALSLAAGALVAWSRAHLPSYSARAAILVLLAVAVGQMIHTTLADYTGSLQERRAQAAELGQLEVLVAKTPGPILADEFMGMLTLQGRPLVIQPFEVTQLARAGKWDQTPLLESIRKQEFAAVILYDRPWSQERWTPEMLEAINQSYRLSQVVADNRVYMAAQPKASSDLTVCPQAAWRLPSDGRRGVQWKDGGLDFFGQGKEGAVPVYAVADGLLMRRTDWVDGVAVLHDDPLHPGEQVWAYYGAMAAANGVDSYVVDDFGLGETGIPVRAGQLLGYQGSWSGRPFWPEWVHAYFVLIRAKDGEIPQNVDSKDILDPAPYLKLGLEPETENKNSQSLKCEQP